MLFSNLLKPEDYRSYFGVGILSLGIGALSAILWTSRITGLLIHNARWLDFLQGLFTGFSLGMVVFSIFVTAKGIVFLRRERAE